jgi:molybdenum cofactor cytidylyltransferase
MGPGCLAARPHDNSRTRLLNPPHSVALVTALSACYNPRVEQMTVGALVVAAGSSRRMGQFKLLLPWGESTVIGQVVATLEAAGIAEVVVVTGHRAAEVAAALARTQARPVLNPRYVEGEMLSSIQAGLAALAETTGAVLLCLGDQPQMQVETVAALLAEARADACRDVIIPSYSMRRGHPILLPRRLWPEVLAAATDLRAVLDAHRDQTRYLVVDTPTVLADLDTVEDYERWQAGIHNG